MLTPVACLNVSSALGGSEWTLLDFLSRAEGLGIAPYLILPKPGPLADEAAKVGVPVGIAPAPESFLELSQQHAIGSDAAVAFAKGLRVWTRAIQEQIDQAALRPAGRPTILYSHGFKALLAGALVREIRHVWHVHEFPPAGLGFAWRLAGRFLPDVVIANSQAVGRAWERGGGPRCAVVLNGVNLERFRTAPRTWWIHDQLGIPRTTRLVGMPAVFARWKGHLKVVEAFERLAATHEDVHLVLVGGPIYDTVAEKGYAEELVRRVRRSSASGTPTEHRLDDRIHFLRFDPQPWRLYPEFDVAVHFSTRPEPFGRVLVEAMACGVPVVAARDGGPQEIIEHGVSGWLTPPEDVAGLAAALAHALASDPEPIGRAARRAVEERFSADRFAADVAAALY